MNANLIQHIETWTGKPLEHEEHLRTLRVSPKLLEELSNVVNLYHISQILIKYNCEFSQVLRLDIVVNLIDLFLNQDLRDIRQRINNLLPFDISEDTDRNRTLAYTWWAADKEKVFEYMCEACPTGNPNFATLLHRGVMRLREMPETARMLWDTSNL